MGTRSFVGVMIGDKCRTIYVHYDGYLKGVGSWLFNGYRSQDEVEALISHGDRSTLTGGYFKDRGETGVEPKDYDTFADFFTDCVGSWCEWYYIFRDGVWYCGSTYPHSPFYKTLTAYSKAVEIEAAEEEAGDA